MFSFFPVHTGVRQGCVHAPSLFNSCMDWIALWTKVAVKHLSATPRSLILFFADDPVIIAVSLKTLVMALEALHEEAKSFGTPGLLAQN